MKRSLVLCSLIGTLVAAAPVTTFAGPETAVSGTAPVVLKPAAPTKEYVCLPDDACAGKPKGLGRRPAAAARASMVIRGIGAHEEAKDARSGGSVKKDGTKAAGASGRVFSVPSPEPKGKERGWGFGRRRLVMTTAVVGARGYGGTEGSEPPGPEMSIDLDALAYLLVMNILDEPVSVYLNDRYLGNVAPGAWSAYFVPAGNGDVSIVTASGEESNDSFEFSAGEMAYYIAGPFEAEAASGKGAPSWLPARSDRK